MFVSSRPRVGSAGIRVGQGVAWACRRRGVTCLGVANMDKREGLLGVGAAADVAGTTVRTLQYYDRIGLLVAQRMANGRRGYDQALLERMHHIRLMSELGLGLDRIAELLARRPDTLPWEVYAEQATMLEMVELRLRCQRAVAAGLANVLRQYPTANVPAEAMRALMNFEGTLRAYRDVAPVEPVENPTDECVDQVIRIYLKWKTLAVQALVMLRHGVDPASDLGDVLGRDWKAISTSLPRPVTPPISPSAPKASPRPGPTPTAISTRPPSIT